MLPRYCNFHRSLLAVCLLHVWYSFHIYNCPPAPSPVMSCWWPKFPFLGDVRSTKKIKAWLASRLYAAPAASRWPRPYDLYFLFLCLPPPPAGTAALLDWLSGSGLSFIRSLHGLLIKKKWLVYLPGQLIVNMVKLSLATMLPQHQISD